MTETSNERLNRLQEEDLGTARREYISTVDRSFNNTRVQAIEASRKSNVLGSKEQRIAEANRSRLDGWANVHKQIGDTGDLEDLDQLLNGQSHRLRLDSMMRGSCAQNHGYQGNNKETFVGHTQKMLVIHGGSSRSVSAASGGPRAPPLNQRRSSRAASIATQPRLNPPGTRSALDPALDRNNATKNTFPWKELKAHKSAGRSASSAHYAPTLRTRRPISNFSPIISSPETFLAAARGMNTANPTTERPSTEKPKPQSPARAKDRSNGSLSLAPDIPSKPAHQKSPSVGKPSDQKVNTGRTASPTPVDKVGLHDHGLNSGSVSLDSDEKTPRAASTDTTDQAKKEETLDTNSPNSAVNAETPTSKLRPQKAVDILLDLSCATPKKPESEAAMSPALEELKGLEFTQFLEPQKPHTSGFASANRKLDFGDALHNDQKSSDLDGAEVTTDLVDDEESEEYKREIDIICQLLERTSLSVTFLSKLTECKEELESRLRPRRSTEQSQQLLTPPAPEPKKPEAIIPEIKKPEAVAPTVIEGTPTHSRKTSEHRIGTPTSQSRLNAAAPQFTPKTFTEYRPLSNATSSDSSTTSQPTPTKIISGHQSEDGLSDSTAVPGAAKKPSSGFDAEPTSAVFPIATQRTSSGSHIFGDHLLPGGRARKPEESHIFGDHLLPGRCVFQSSVAQPTALPIAESVLAPAAPTWPTIAFSTAPRPLKIVNPNTPVTSKAKSPNGSSLTPSAPHFEPTNKAVGAKPKDVTTPTAAVSTTLKTAKKTTSMMESIYAPKTNVYPSLAPQKKLPASQGLSTSRYSDPKWI
ncbi:hypothetical protein BJX76DRAFT_355802 [Aspergillus varians]